MVGVGEFVPVAPSPPLVWTYKIKALNLRFFLRNFVNSVRLRLEEVTGVANRVLRFETRKFLSNQDEQFRHTMIDR